MLTIIMLILLALVVRDVGAWWLFEIDVPDVVVAATAPAAGACIIYFYGTLCLGRSASCCSSPAAPTSSTNGCAILSPIRTLRQNSLGFRKRFVMPGLVPGIHD